jgi:hypothetical protein
MLRKLLTKSVSIHIILCLQVVPILLFPLSSYKPTSQEWWLPALLTLFILIGLFQLLFRRTQKPWPWYLLSFSQGFNIISRLMMLMPHSTEYVDRVQQFNGDYVVVTIAAMLVSAFEIWFTDLPEVRNEMLRTRAERAPA